MPQKPYMPQMTAGKQTLDFLNLYKDVMPGIAEQQQGLVSGQAGAEANAATSNQGQYNLSNLLNIILYGSPLAQAGQQISLDTLKGTGGQTAEAAMDLARKTSPEYYSLLGEQSNRAKDLLGAINLKGLSPGEFNATERALNQAKSGTGNLGLINNTNSISDAINYGGAYNAKLGILNNALNTGTNVTNSAVAGSLNPTSANALATGGAGFGLGAFNSVNPTSASGAASNALSMGNNIFSNIMGAGQTGMTAAANVNSAQIGATKGPQWLGATSGMIGNVCCFIFLEAYHGKLPAFIRKSRDRYYTINPDIAAGYRMMAYYLVPLMRRSSFIRALVWHLMVSPITEYLGWSNRQVGYIRRSSHVTHFWLRVWALLGKGRVESHFNTQWKGFKYV
jgi:hypothetical protein